MKNLSLLSLMFLTFPLLSAETATKITAADMKKIENQVWVSDSQKGCPDAFKIQSVSGKNKKGSQLFDVIHFYKDEATGKLNAKTVDEFEIKIDQKNKAQKNKVLNENGLNAISSKTIYSSGGFISLTSSLEFQAEKINKDKARVVSVWSFDTKNNSAVITFSKQKDPSSGLGYGGGILCQYTPGETTAHDSKNSVSVNDVSRDKVKYVESKEENSKPSSAKTSTLSK